VATIAMPILVPAIMHLVFRSAHRRFGPRRGDQAGFAIYWATCWATTAALVGPRRLPLLWQRPVVPLPAPKALAWAALTGPTVGAIATQWLPHAATAGPRAVAVAVGVGVTNAVAEEALWRGTPVTAFPSDPVPGWLWPAVGFTLWHLVPLTASSSSRRRKVQTLLGAALIGFGNGWLAWRTRSLVATSVAHAVTDACGVEPVRRIWLGANLG
jgi:membrane protease YdiL (CAAX protease family)